MANAGPERQAPDLPCGDEMNRDLLVYLRDAGPASPAAIRTYLANVCGLTREQVARTADGANMPIWHNYVAHTLQNEVRRGRVKRLDDGRYKLDAYVPDSPSANE